MSATFPIEIGTFRSQLKATSRLLGITTGLLFQGAFFHLFLLLPHTETLRSLRDSGPQAFNLDFNRAFLGYLGLILACHTLPALVCQRISRLSKDGSFCARMPRRVHFILALSYVIPALPIPVYLLLTPFCLTTALIGLLASMTQLHIIMSSITGTNNLFHPIHKMGLQALNDIGSELNPVHRDACIFNLAGLAVMTIFQLTEQTTPSMGKAALCYSLLTLAFSLMVEWRILRRRVLLSLWSKRKTETGSRPVLRHSLFTHARPNLLLTLPFLLALLVPCLRASALSMLFLRQLGIMVWAYASTRQQKIDINRYIDASGQTLIYSILVLIAIGGTILALPASSADGKSIGVLNAFFTSASATCVTGFTVVDTATAFSPLGKTVICILFQLGGLGIMTLSFFLALMLNNRMGVVGNSVLADLTGEERLKEAKRLLKCVVRGTFLIEFIGAILLSFAYYCQPNQLSLGQCIGYGSFLSISSFCNAGFSLHSDSVATFAQFPFALLTIAGLVMAGGLSFLVFIALADKLKNPCLQHPWDCHAKLVLCVTTTLWIVGTIVFFFDENNHIFQPLDGFRDSFLNAFFHAVSTRSAGFASVDVQNMTHASKMFSIFLMFVGVCPGSCGGGIKVAALGVFLLQMRSWLRGEREVVFCGRKIPQVTLNHAGFIIGIMAFIAVTGAFVLSLLMPDLLLEDILFEAVSATATVGMSTGITPMLSPPAKIVLMLIMFLGRIGPLTFLFAFVPRHNRTIEYAETKIFIV